MPPRRISVAGQALQDKCAKAMAEWDECDGPAEIEDAVNAFLPQEEPMRSAAIDMLAKVRAPLGPRPLLARARRAVRPGAAPRLFNRMVFHAARVHR